MPDTAMDPRPFLAEIPMDTRFIRNLPDPDDLMCGWGIPADAGVVTNTPVGTVGFTTCHLPPGHGPRHVGLRVVGYDPATRWVDTVLWEQRRPLGHLIQRPS